MIRSVKIKISFDESQKKILLETMEEYSKVFNFYSSWSVERGSTSKVVAHKETYELSKQTFPSMPVALIQSGRDMALESNKNKRKKKVPSKKLHSAIRYNANCFSLRGRQLTLSSMNKRLKTIIKTNSYNEKYFNDFKLIKTGYLSFKNDEFYFVFLFELEDPKQKEKGNIIGIDRGIINVVALSDGTLISGKELRKNQRKHLFLKRKLQSKGTRSARRLLRSLRGKEKRFSLNFLHCASRQLVDRYSDGAKVFVLENLSKLKMKKFNKKSNKIISSWSFKLLEELLSYKAKEKGIDIQHVDARFTSQICSNCSDCNKSNRSGGRYHCEACGLAMHADVNAAINIKNRFIISSSNLNSRQDAVNHPDVREQSSRTSSQPCAASS